MLFFEHFADYIESNRIYNEHDIYASSDILTMTAYITGAEFAIDRCEGGELNKYSKYNIDIPRYIDGIEFDKNIKYEKMPLDEICYKVSQDYIIKANAQSQKIAVLWSGGVDSTLVMCAFLRNKNLNLNNFQVWLSDNSITENPYFFEKYIQSKCSYVKFNSNEYVQFINNTYQNYIIISGSNGDELFDNKYCLFYPLFYCVKYTEILSSIYKLYLGDNNTDDFIDKLAEQHSKIFKQYFNSIFDFDINTLEDFTWALVFMFKWCSSRLDNILRCSNINLINHYYTFYSHKLFQQWALYNKKYREYVNPYIGAYQYKKPFKNYIFQYDNNIDYLNNKSKIHSYVECINSKNYNKIVIFDNHGIETYKIPLSKKSHNIKYRDIYEVNKILNKYKNVS